jgi:hypothetical protein
MVYVEPRPEAGWAPHLNPDVLVGLVAGDARTALRALRDWCGALELAYVQPECKVPDAAGLAAVQGSVYIKYNSRGPVSRASDPVAFRPRAPCPDMRTPVSGRRRRPSLQNV